MPLLRPPRPLHLAAIALAAAGAIAPGPATAQMLLDAAAAGSAQGALQQQGSTGYGQTLNQVRGSLASSSASTAPGTAAPSTAATAPAGPTEGGTGGAPNAAPPPTGSLVINNRPVPTCSSGLPCLGSIRRALGLQP